MLRVEIDCTYVDAAVILRLVDDALITAGYGSAVQTHIVEG